MKAVMTAVIVTGDRHATPEKWDYAIGYALTSLQDGDIVIHGAARGIDTLADGTAKALNLDTAPVPADWSKGRKAGPLRNAQMLADLMRLEEGGYEIEVWAFHDDIDNSKGTKDMVRQARAAGVPVTVYRSDGSAS